MDTCRQTASDREDVFHPTAPQCGGTRLRLHKPLLSPALGGSKFGVRDEVSLQALTDPALTILPCQGGEAGNGGTLPARPPGSRQWGWLQKCGRTSDLTVLTGLWGREPRPGPPAAAPRPPRAPRLALTCRGRGRDPGRGRGRVVPRAPAQRLTRGAVRRRPVLKAASRRRGPDPGQGPRAAAARRQRRPPGWPRCPWRAGGVAVGVAVSPGRRLPGGCSHSRRGRRRHLPARLAPPPAAAHAHARLARSLPAHAPPSPRARAPAGP